MNFINNAKQKDAGFVDREMNNICASIQNIIIQTLLDKLCKAAKDLEINHIAIAGGVSANSGLRQAIKEYGEKYAWKTYIPKFEYCTDNAAMIAITAHYKFLKGAFSSQSVSPQARMKI